MVGEQEQPQNKDSWIRRVMEHPAYVGVTGIAAIVGIITLPLSIYLFYAGRQVPDLTYYVSPTRTAIVTNQSNQKLSVAYDGKPVQGDISSAQVTIWNAGSKPIRRADFLTPVRLIFPARNPILDAKVVDVSRPLIDFNGDIGKAGTGVLTLDWRILEHNDGVKLQVIYGGEPTARIVLHGAIVGQRAPSERSAADLGHQEDTSATKEAIIVTLAAISCVSVGFLFLRDMFKGLKKGRSKLRKFDLTVFVSFISIVCAIMGAAVWAVFHIVFANYLNTPPFGF